jgi:large subunit ribosomal protein L29
MQARELREQTDEQILDEIEDLKESLFKLRLQQSSGQLEDSNQLKYTRRSIARCQTILNERRLAAQVASKEGSNA